MIYLIGGPPRCGKSMLATKLLRESVVPYVSTDALFHMVKQAAPTLGISSNIKIEEKVELFFPFLEQFVRLIRSESNGYTIEGDVIWPNQAKKISEKYKVKSIFLGFESIRLEDMIENVGSNDWVLKLSDGEKRGMPDWIKSMSLQFKEECNKYGMKYIDMSENFSDKLNLAYNILKDENKGLEE